MMMHTALLGKIIEKRRDLFAVFILSVLAFTGSILLSLQLNNVVLSSSGLDFWFQSDTARVFWNMSDPASDHNRATVHPLFSLLTTPFVLTWCKVFSVDRLSAVRITIALVAGGWAMMMYILLRLLGLFRGDAFLFTTLGLLSSSSIFWFSVPETFSFGSLSILFAFILLARSTTLKSAGEPAFILAGVLTLGFTVTNWMVGLLTSFLSLPWKKALCSNAAAFMIVAALSFYQRFFLKSIPFFVGRTNKGMASSADEIRYLFMDDTGGSVRIVFSFFHHAIIMPAIQYGDKMHREGWKILSVQFSDPLVGSLAGIITGVLWAALFGVGCWALCTVKEDVRVRVGVGLSLAGQLILHLVYGDETFLYAMHFLPMLIIIAAYGVLTKIRKVVLVMACVVCVGLAVNNLTQFFWAAEMLNTHFHVKGP